MHKVHGGLNSWLFRRQQPTWDGPEASSRRAFQSKIFICFQQSPLVVDHGKSPRRVIHTFPGPRTADS